MIGLVSLATSVLTALCFADCRTSLSPTGASLPDDQILTYSVHETDSDRDSPLEWTICLDLHAESRNGDTVGWSVTAIEITQYDSDGQPYRSWSEQSPSVDISDGLWEVTHADADDPQASDFGASPKIEGTAAKKGSEPADLEYEVGSASSSSANLAWVGMSYYFAMVGSQEPEEEEDDKPVWTDISEDPARP